MKIRQWMAGGWTVLLLLACWLPSHALPRDEGEVGRRIPMADKIVHAALFAGFGGLWMAALAGRPRRAARVLAGGVLLAVVSEAGQAIPALHRDASLNDGLADVAGLAIGVGASLVWRRSPRPAPEPEPAGSVPS